MDLPDSTELQVERAHCTLVPKPPPNVAPRSIVVKMANFRLNETILKAAWQKHGLG